MLDAIDGLGSRRPRDTREQKEQNTDTDEVLAHGYRP
jgi:hypothetical protein